MKITGQIEIKSYEVSMKDIEGPAIGIVEMLVDGFAVKVEFNRTDRQDLSDKIMAAFCSEEPLGEIDFAPEIKIENLVFVKTVFTDRVFTCKKTV